MKFLNRLWKLFVDSVFPESIYCICCGNIINKSRTYWMCDSCIKKWLWNTARTCPKCGKAVSEEYPHTLCYNCQAVMPIYTKGAGCSTYSLLERNVIEDFKYNGKSYLAKPLGSMLVDKLDTLDWIYDLIVPVPVYKNRLKERGYNHAELLAKEIHLQKKKGLCVNALLRKKSTRVMKTLDAYSRQKNIEGAFVFNDAMKAKIFNKTILLVDDIMTTGATANECAKVLLEAGAKEIYVIAIASGKNMKDNK